MIWLLWRRSRLMLAVAGIALGTMAALVLAAGAVAGPDGSAYQPASVRRAGVPVRDPAQPSADPLVHRGLLLMSAAAAACQSVSYRGVQIVAWSGPGESSSYLLDVWHRPGEPELAQDDGDGDDQGSFAQPPGAASGRVAVSVLSVSPGMLSLLRTNYLIEYAGSGSSSSRPALIVAVRRHDGTLAARYWLDRATSLPLRREMFDQNGRRVSEGAFIDVEIGDHDIGLVPAAQGPAWDSYVPAVPGQAAHSPPTTARLTALREQGWPVPKTLAGNMALVGVTRAATRSGRVLDASYSDGLSVVSVFMQRGQLPATLAGWHAADVGGLQVYSSGSSDLDKHGLAWSAHGRVYTVIADAPPETVAQIVAQLPHDRVTGFWQRVVRGLKRMGSWFDPFG